MHIWVCADFPLCLGGCQEAALASLIDVCSAAPSGNALHMSRNKKIRVVLG